jgi:hypothetical protein
MEFMGECDSFWEVLSCLRVSLVTVVYVIFCFLIVFRILCTRMSICYERLRIDPIS